MDSIWQSAPAPAWRIRARAGAAPTVEPNPAAQRWAADAGLGADPWPGLAARLAEAAAHGAGPQRVMLGARSVSVVSVALDDGWLLWMLPPAPGAAGDVAEWQQRVERAEQATRFLDRALSLAGVSVWRLDLETRRMHFNGVGFTLAGLEREPAGVPLDRIRQTIHPDDLDAVQRAADAAIAGDGAVELITRYRQIDGSWLSLLTRRVADRDAQGRAMALAGISIDLSAQLRERKHYEALVERTRLVAEVIGVGFWSLDVDEGQVHWDEQMYRIYRRDPALGPVDPAQWVEQLVHPDDRAWMSERLRRANERWEPNTELSFRAVPGPEGERWIQTWARRLTHGGRRWMFGMHMDMSDRRRAQLEAQRVSERTQWAIDTAGVGIWERDARGRWLYWNEAMYRLRGVDPADPRPLGEIATQCIHPEDARRLDALVRSHLEMGTPYRAEVRVVGGGDRPWRWLMTRGQTVRDAAGVLLGMVGVNLDVTERKEAEALQREKERVEQASRDKSDFMARMSHELRTPLNAVLGFARLIEDDLHEPPTPRQRERLRQVSAAGLRLLALVDDMLDLARVEAPESAGPAQPLGVAELLAELETAVQGTAREQGVALHFERPPAELRVLADRPRVLRALTLVLEHALRRSAPGSRVQLEARAAGDGPMPRLALVVRDGGPGLTAHQHLWLFESFAPEGPADDDGSGLIRLSLARGLVQAMGGRVDALTAPDGGVEIHIELPRALAASAALELLCVEDNPVNLQLVRELVGLRPQLRLRTAVDGASGIAAARASAPDVLLLDLQLPDMHGIEVMRRLRAEPALARTRFIALSADAMPEHVKAALDAGFDAYWTKPIDFGRFLGELDRLAGAAATAAAGTAPPS